MAHDAKSGSLKLVIMDSFSLNHEQNIQNYVYTVHIKLDRNNANIEAKVDSVCFLTNAMANRIGFRTVALNDFSLDHGPSVLIIGGTIYQQSTNEIKKKKEWRVFANMQGFEFDYRN